MKQETATGAARRADGKRAGHIPPVLMVTLALLSGIAPFGTDMYLPAFPAMTRELAASSAGGR